MKRLAWILMITVAPTLAAQEPPSLPPPDSGGDVVPSAQAQQLRQRIRQRWSQQVRTTLALNDEQATKVQGTEQRFEEQRQPLRARRRDINQALSAELAAGAPDQERVKQLITERQENQRKLEEINRGEDREMQGYLTPVQRARYQELRRRFQERVAEVMRNRRDARGGVRRRR
jgi:Spy/CpxP family protein refolding chaperone